jgi:hypothetical protein
MNDIRSVWFGSVCFFCVVDELLSNAFVFMRTHFLCVVGKSVFERESDEKKGLKEKSNPKNEPKHDPHHQPKKIFLPIMMMVV